MQVGYFSGVLYTIRQIFNAQDRVVYFLESFMGSLTRERIIYSNCFINSGSKKSANVVWVLPTRKTRFTEKIKEKYNFAANGGASMR